LRAAQARRDRGGDRVRSTGPTDPGVRLGPARAGDPARARSPGRAPVHRSTRVARPPRARPRPRSRRRRRRAVLVGTRQAVGYDRDMACRPGHAGSTGRSRMFAEFKAFLMKTNALALAIGVIIGA